MAIDDKFRSPWCPRARALLMELAFLAPAPRAASPGVPWRFATSGRSIITAPAVGRDGTLYAASSDGVLCVGGVRYADPLSVVVRIGARGAIRVFTDRGRYVSADFGAHGHSMRAAR